MNLNEALHLLESDGWSVARNAGYSTFDYTLEEYKEQVKIELQKEFGYTNVDWVNSDYWSKLIKKLFDEEKGVDFAAEVLYEYDYAAHAEEESDDTSMDNYDFEYGDYKY